MQTHVHDRHAAYPTLTNTHVYIWALDSCGDTCDMPTKCTCVNVHQSGIPHVALMTTILPSQGSSINAGYLECVTAVWLASK